jgi:hypothetical protein
MTVKNYGHKRLCNKGPKSILQAYKALLQMLITVITKPCKFTNECKFGITAIFSNFDKTF